MDLTRYYRPSDDDESNLNNNEKELISQERDVSQVVPPTILEQVEEINLLVRKDEYINKSSEVPLVKGDEVIYLKKVRSFTLWCFTIFLSCSVSVFISQNKGPLLALPSRGRVITVASQNDIPNNPFLWKKPNNFLPWKQEEKIIYFNKNKDLIESVSVDNKETVMSLSPEEKEKIINSFNDLLTDYKKNINPMLRFSIDIQSSEGYQVIDNSKEETKTSLSSQFDAMIAETESESNIRTVILIVIFLEDLIMTTIIIYI